MNMTNRNRQNTYYDEDVMATIRAEQRRRFPGRGLTFSLTINSIIREWKFWADFRQAQERKALKESDK